MRSLPATGSDHLPPTRKPVPTTTSAAKWLPLRSVQTRYLGRGGEVLVSSMSRAVVTAAAKCVPAATEVVDQIVVYPRPDCGADLGYGGAALGGV
jgi:hypothetical protein